jgi:aryl-alcohol dehydrogenase-like predicted oxidoreductase
VSTVILGASKVSQLKENLQAMEAASKLTPDIMKRIDDFMPVDSVI